MFSVTPLGPAITIEILAPFRAPEALERRIDEIWAAERERRAGALSNGPVYSLDAAIAGRLRIRRAEYRHVIAQRCAPELVDLGLRLRPLAVTGVLFCTDGVALGRRGGQVAADASLWEPAPAGGLSQPDPARQIFEELREEVGLEQAQIDACDICGLVEDHRSGVVDIVFRLIASVRTEEIQAAHGTRATNEYSELAVVPRAEISNFLAANENSLLPALRPMLALAGAA
jgi:hypothetical protein